MATAFSASAAPRHFTAWCGPSERQFDGLHLKTCVFVESISRCLHEEEIGGGTSTPSPLLTATGLQLGVPSHRRSPTSTRGTIGSFVAGSHSGSRAFSRALVINRGYNLDDSNGYIVNYTSPHEQRNVSLPPPLLVSLRCHPDQTEWRLSLQVGSGTEV